MSLGMQEENHHSEVKLPNGVQWQPQSCWDNIYDAINDCRVLCYIVGMYTVLLLLSCGDLHALYCILAQL